MMPINTGINALRNEDISHGTAIMNFGRVMAGSLGTALMVTFMSIGAKYSALVLQQVRTMKYYKDRVLQLVDLSFAIVTGLVIIGFISLYLSKRKDTIIKIQQIHGICKSDIDRS